MIQENIMSQLTIYHGSDHIIKKPNLSLGKTNNDYGQGFYCTEDLELAKEWACKNNNEGYVNSYTLNTLDLKILNLNSSDYSILNWIAILLKHRTFKLDSEIAVSSRDYIIKEFGLNTKEFDVIIGYRADDSYFSFAESFVENTLPLRTLNKALRFGNLGEQIVLVSEKSFEKLKYNESIEANKNIYYPKFILRDNRARQSYRNESKGTADLLADIFVLDIIRQELKNDDPRIQRILSE